MERSGRGHLRRRHRAHDWLGADGSSDRSLRCDAYSADLYRRTLVRFARRALSAILDISALVSSQARDSQNLALQLMRIYARHIENANFLRMHRQDWILKLNTSPEFVDVDPEYLIALDESGRIVDHNRRAHEMLAAKLVDLPINLLVNGETGSGKEFSRKRCTARARSAVRRGERRGDSRNADRKANCSDICRIAFPARARRASAV